jgi:hypothetical protein
MATTEQIQTEVLEPMRSLFRVPFGIESPEEALGQYAKALTRFSVETLRAGWGRLVETHRKRDWPSIADMLESLRAIEPSNVVRADFKRQQAGEDEGLHEARIVKSPEMNGFLFRKADALRKNANWVNFLDSIHPTAEHCFFSHASMGAYATELTGLTEFECIYIRQNWGERLAKIFGGHVYLKATQKVGAA